MPFCIGDKSTDRTDQFVSRQHNQANTMASSNHQQPAATTTTTTPTTTILLPPPPTLNGIPLGILQLILDNLANDEQWLAFRSLGLTSRHLHNLFTTNPAFMAQFLRAREGNRQRYQRLLAVLQTSSLGRTPVFEWQHE